MELEGVKLILFLLKLIPVLLLIRSFSSSFWKLLSWTWFLSAWSSQFIPVWRLSRHWHLITAKQTCTEMVCSILLVPRTLRGYVHTLSNPNVVSLFLGVATRLSSSVRAFSILLKEENAWRSRGKMFAEEFSTNTVLG